MTHFDPTLPEVYVQPGESHLVDRPSVMRTILGSCVGIAWHVPGHGLGALCHPMLPNVPSSRGSAITLANGRRYVDFTIREMAAQLESRGISRAQIRIKLFGGADVLDVVSDAARPTVGQQNADTAARILREEGFQIAVSRLGGIQGLHLSFHTGTGEVLVRRLPASTRTHSLPRSTP